MLLVLNCLHGMQVPGDLDPKASPHYLTTMKKAYLKLRYLVDCGCIFVGHDLRHDFKSINITVPAQQVWHFPTQQVPISNHSPMALDKDGGIFSFCCWSNGRSPILILLR